MFDRPISSTRLKIAQVLLGGGLLGIVVELFTGQHSILYWSVPAAIVGSLLGLSQTVCRACGMRQTSICEKVTHCSVCGAALSVK